VFPEATHWLQHEEPDEVVAEILGQVRAHGPAGAPH
jgi:pimeloyl-ACP methyl ester carboxylesterase